MQIFTPSVVQTGGFSGTSLWCWLLHHTPDRSITFQHPVLVVAETVPIYPKSAAYALIFCHKNFSLRKETRSLPNQQWLPEKVGFLSRAISKDMTDFCYATIHKTYCSHLTLSLDSCSLSGSHRMQWLPISSCFHLL